MVKEIKIVYWCPVEKKFNLEKCKGGKYTMPPFRIDKCRLDSFENCNKEFLIVEKDKLEILRKVMIQLGISCNGTAEALQKFKIAYEEAVKEENDYVRD